MPVTSELKANAIRATDQAIAAMERDICFMQEVSERFAKAAQTSLGLVAEMRRANDVLRHTKDE